MRYFTRFNIALLFLCVAVTNAQVEASSIGINFHGGSGNDPANGASVTGVAGAPGFAQAQWNNVAIPPGGQTGTALSLVNDLGLATPATATWAVNGTFDTGIALGTQNDNLMRGFLDVFGGTPGTVTVAGIPFSTFDVIVYFDGANGNQAQVMSFTIGAQSIFGLDAANTQFNGTFTQVASSSTSDLGAATPAGNFVVFNLLSGNSFTLTATAGSSTGGTQRARINGLQIVEVLSAPVPLPSQGAVWLLGLGLLGLLGMRAARKR